MRTIQLGEKAVRMAEHRQVPEIVTVTGLRLGRAPPMVSRESQHGAWKEHSSGEQPAWLRASDPHMLICKMGTALSLLLVVVRSNERSHGSAREGVNLPHTQQLCFSRPPWEAGQVVMLISVGKQDVLSQEVGKEVPVIELCVKLSARHLNMLSQFMLLVSL